jgi:hypothetical protein
MENFLQTKDAAFFHITTWSNWEKIQKQGLKSFNGKGVSVIRVEDERVINSIIALQLNSIEIEEENDFVLLKLKQHRNKFELHEVEPDIVDEWTWPLHNNIMRKIHQNYIDFVKRFSVDDWNKINIDDFKNEKIIILEKEYLQSFNLVYKNKEDIFYTVGSSKQITITK